MAQFFLALGGDIIHQGEFMQFHRTSLNDAWLIHLEPVRDLRGFFSRTFCSLEFAERGLETTFPQHSISYSKWRGTVRGMHYQREPHCEVKVVRCAKGTIWDVVIDLRETSPTYLRWEGFELSEHNCYELYIPKGFAHGFQTLSDDVEVSYLISEPYAPDFASGIRYDDPAIGIKWPLSVTRISEKDMHWPSITEIDRSLG